MADAKSNLPTLPAPMGAGTDVNDYDADDLPASNGTPDGHADCVPGADDGDE